MKLYALNAQSGQVDWSAGLNTTVRTDMATYDDGKVFVFDSIFSASKMNAYDAASGALLWSSSLPGQSSFDTPPNGMVYVGGSGIGQTLYALRETDGSMAWTNFAGSGTRLYPVVADDGVYVMNSGPDVFKLDPLTGVPIWHYASGTSGGGGRSMVYSNGRLYVRALIGPSFGTNEIAILDAINGSLLTSFQPGAPSVPAISAGIGFSENKGTLIAFDAITGANLWSKTNPGDQFVSAPIVVNGTVFEGTTSGKVFALDAQSGLQLAMDSWWCPQAAW